MTPAAQHVLLELETKLRDASVAEVGGFRPPQDPLTSWFGRGSAAAGEPTPLWRGEPMLPLLQVRLDELPVRPRQLNAVSFLVLYMNAREYPFDRPNGDGWLIREYGSLDGLVPLRDTPTLPGLKPFPVRWSRLESDGPGWEAAWSLVDLHPVNDDEDASEVFFERFHTSAATKFGGYPREIQHGLHDLETFVFQVGSEPKANWMWADHGIGYFFRSAVGEWSWSCQFY